MGKFVGYVRVSSQRQGRSGLGLAAQQTALEEYVSSHAGELVEVYTEVETGKGADALRLRPQLRAAMLACKKLGATLLVAKVDRLARNVHFVSGLIESRTPFVCCDMPHAGKLELQIFSMMAEHERDQISARTKAALAEAKARGVRLGVAGPGNLRPNIEARRKRSRDFAGNLIDVLKAFAGEGCSQRQMAIRLNEMGVGAPRGGIWSHRQISRVLAKASFKQSDLPVAEAVEGLPVERRIKPTVV